MPVFSPFPVKPFRFTSARTIPKTAADAITAARLYFRTCNGSLAQIAASAKIGPFCVIGSKAKIGENVQLIAHVTIMNDTTIGDGTIVFPGAPESAITGKKYRGINNLFLSLIAMSENYGDNRWATFKQMEEKGWTF